MLNIVATEQEQLDSLLKKSFFKQNFFLLRTHPKHRLFHMNNGSPNNWPLNGIYFWIIDTSEYQSFEKSWPEL